MHLGMQELLVVAIIGLIGIGVVAGLVAIIYVICKASQKPKPPADQ